MKPTFTNKHFYFKNYFLLFFLIIPFVGFSGKADPPRLHGLTSVTAAANNECSGALPLTFGVPLSDNNIGSTQSLPGNDCGNFVTSLANDVWFTFTYTAAMDCVVVVPPPNPNVKMMVELFSGNCGALTFLSCGNFPESGSNNRTTGIYLGSFALNVGTSYKLRVYGYDGYESSFNVLLKTSSSLPPPSNDECAAPINLLVATTFPGTTVGATQSVAPITCQTNTSTDAKDVWFRFTKTAAMDSIALFPALNNDFVVDVRSNNCLTGNSLLCSDQGGVGKAEKLSIAGLANGTIYFIRIYAKNNTSGDFSIRIKSAPSNNNCTGAIDLPNVNPVLGKTIDASQSLPPSSCLGKSDDDVWYKFTMSAAYDSIKVKPNLFYNAVLELRSGTCANSTPITCSNGDSSNATEKIFLGALTSGTTYFIRVYSFGAGESSEGGFTINLVGAPTTPPSNDNCTNPIQINGGALVSGTNENATQTAAGVPCGGAVSTNNKDVWYRFVKTDAMDTVLVDGLFALDAMLDIRQNTCPSGTVVACLDQSGNELKKTDISFLTNGTTYLLRVYGRDGATGNFSVGFLDGTSVVTPPANDECFEAIPLTLSTTCSGTAGTNTAATETLPASITCSGANAGTAKDVWYSFTANATRAIAKVTCNVGFDGAIQVYSGSCFGLASIGCADVYGESTDPDFPATEEVFLTGLSSGTTYYVRVYGYNGDEGDFSVCVYNPNCNSTVPVLATNTTNLLSNQAFSTSLTGTDGEVLYQISRNQTVWGPGSPSLTGTTDTLTYASAVSGPVYLRATNRTGSCYPAISNVVTLNVRCATPFENGAGFDRITKVTFGTIDQTSTVDPMGGSVQDFSQVSTNVCRGNSYPLGITVNSATTPYNRMVWIDFNADGDFADAGENVLFGPYVAGALSTNSITIPATTPLGSCRMRIAIIDNEAAITSADPCATGPYLWGEIEEYTLNVSTGVVAQAGAPQNVCATTFTLNGNDPGAGGTGVWSVVSGTGTFVNANQFNTVVNGLTSGVNVFRWTLTTSCGTSQATVSITSTKVLAQAGPDQNVCLTTGVLNSTAPTFGTGAWSVLSGGGTVLVPNSTNTGVSNLAVGPNQFVWTVTSPAPGCPPAKDTITIFRKTAPTADAGVNLALCGTSTTMAATAPTTGTGAWSVVSGSGNFVNTALANTQVSGLSFGTNTLRWTVTDAPCAPVTDEVNVVNNLPGKPNAGLDTTFCSLNGTLRAKSIPVGLSGTWSVVSGSATLATPNNATTAFTNATAGTNQFAFTIQVPACSTQVSDTIKLQNEGNPISLGNDSAHCFNLFPTYTLIGPSGMGSYLWNNGTTTQQNVITLAGAGVNILTVGTPGGCTFKDTIIITNTICDAVAELGSGIGKSVRIYPNPTLGTSALEFNLLQPEEIEIQIYDVKGSSVGKSSKYFVGENSVVALPENLPAGMYQVKLTGKTFAKTLKWVRN